ncbi:PTS sugar transporter subunit IIA [Streptococcus dentapri]|uniref:PTS sugar transporter subunit IIA n=1 Tax=Streptococcus dentapri TaxID=573564 RepID=A0ABV8D2W7_9STRE
MSSELVKKLFIEEPLHNPSEVYHFLAEQIAPFSNQEVIEKLLAREHLANIQIYQQTILPHLELRELERSQLLILRLQDPIIWDEDMGEVKLIICLALKVGEVEKVKRQIRDFMIHLANDAYLEELLQAEKIDIEKI